MRCSAVRFSWPLPSAIQNSKEYMLLLKFSQSKLVICLQCMFYVNLCKIKNLTEIFTAFLNVSAKRFLIIFKIHLTWIIFKRVL